MLLFVALGSCGTSRIEQKATIPDESPSISPKLQLKIDSTYALGEEHLSAGNLVQAIECFKQVLQWQPKMNEAANQMVAACTLAGVDCYGKGDLEEALKFWKMAIPFAGDKVKLSDYIKRTEDELQKLKELSNEG